MKFIKETARFLKTIKLNANILKNNIKQINQSCFNNLQQKMGMENLKNG